MSNEKPKKGLDIILNYISKPHQMLSYSFSCGKQFVVKPLLEKGAMFEDYSYKIRLKEDFSNVRELFSSYNSNFKLLKSIEDKISLNRQNIVSLLVDYNPSSKNEIISTLKYNDRLIFGIKYSSGGMNIDSSVKYLQELESKNKSRSKPWSFKLKNVKVENKYLNNKFLDNNYNIKSDKDKFEIPNVFLVTKKNDSFYLVLE